MRFVLLNSVDNLLSNRFNILSHCQYYSSFYNGPNIDFLYTHCYVKFINIMDIQSISLLFTFTSTRCKIYMMDTRLPSNPSLVKNNIYDFNITLF